MAKIPFRPSSRFLELSPMIKTGAYGIYRNGNQTKDPISRLLSRNRNTKKPIGLFRSNLSGLNLEKRDTISSMNLHFQGK